MDASGNLEQRNQVVMAENGQTSNYGTVPILFMYR